MDLFLSSVHIPFFFFSLQQDYNNLKHGELNNDKVGIDALYIYIYVYVYI